MQSNPLRERLAGAEWSSPTAFTFEGISFGLVDVGAPRAEPPALNLKKPASSLWIYADALAGRRVNNVLELGLNHGGSAAFFAALLQPHKLVSLDISEPVRRFDAFLADNPIGRRIVPHYRTSQADEARLRDIIAQEFQGPLDLVLDDASHDYGLTRASFEVLFPLIRPGGCYVVEDWQWAHAPGFWDRADQPALSNLLFQLMMAQPGHPDLIARIDVFPSIAFVWKGEAAVSAGRLDVEALGFLQNRSYALI
jgi:predicted O-methyltransferase YrrM